MAILELALRNPLEARLGYQLRRASGVLMADLGSRLATLDLTPTEASILILIEANPGAIQTDIGRALAVKRANMVPLVAGLMARDLIAREAADGRSHALTVTEAGRKRAREAQRMMQEHEDCFFGDLAAGDTRIWLSRLRRIWAEIENGG
jgi:DNA-binding MarR family transcriptional regulator